ncbi:MAG: aldolase/citrate lyase family protein [Acuticoccus sp.]
MSAFDPAAPRLKPRLEKGAPTGVLWVTLGSVTLIEIAARHAPDAIAIDMQHGLFDRLSLEQAVAAAGAPVLVRTRDAMPASIGEALDAGAEGVIVPLVESGAAARAVAAACRYPPDGERSGGGIRPLADFGLHATKANAGIVAGVMIETAAGVAAADAIAGSDVDFVFIGTGDLALSLGTTPGSADHQAACDTVLAACRKAKVPCGIFAMSAEAAAGRIGEGYALTVAGIDLDCFEGAARAALTHFSANARPPARPRQRTTRHKPA